MALVTPYRRTRDYRRWKQAGRPAPPPHFVKQRIIRSYAKRSGLKVLIETGTYLGDMVQATRGLFREIHSIELSADLYARAIARFRNANKIHLYQGDSAVVLPQILQTMAEPCLFWLDGHYSAGITAKGDRETPVMDELRSIFNSWRVEHVILIDDARCFDGTNEYPSLEDLKTFVDSRQPGLAFEVKDDVVRIHAPAVLTTPAQP